MATTPAVRPAAPDDLPSLAHLWYEKMVLQQQADRRLQFAPDAERRWRQAAELWLADPDTALLVAESDGQPVGYLIVQLRAGAPGLLPERVGLLVDMALDTHHYRAGAGRGLVAAARAWLVSRGAAQLTISVSRRSAIEQAFWRALGAQEWMENLWMTL